MMSEKWLPVPGYEGLYSVSDQGRIRSENRLIGNGNGFHRRWSGRILKAAIVNKVGKGRRYAQVTLYKNGKLDRIRVQYLVMQAFVGPRPAGLEVLHRDYDATNNTLINLRYGTHAENKADEMRNSTHCRSGQHRWDEQVPYIRPDTKTRQCRKCLQERNESRYTT